MTTLFQARRATASALAMLFLTAPMPALAQDEPQEFNAFAVVQVSGTFVKTGEKQVIIVAALSGTFLIETDEGPIHSGTVACPGTVRANLNTTLQSGSGACAFTAGDGATSWGEWECTDFNIIGCRGTSKLTGGTADLAGVTGEAALIWRPSSHELKKHLDGSVLQNATGILIWRDFKIVKK